MTDERDGYRENHKRAIYVAGEINEELLHKLTPQINELRCTSRAPITVYIDSVGGYIAVAERLRGLLAAPTPKGESCRLVTVVTGLAASAAADLLALGEYAIALPSADIVHHGTRQQSRAPITYELATFLASRIKEENELFAQRLARKVFVRIVFRASQFDRWLNEYRSNDLTELDGLIRELTERLQSQNQELLYHAQQKQTTIRDLTSFVKKHLARFKEDLPFPQFESEVLKAIVKYHYQSKKNFALGFGGIEEVKSDFELLHDFYFGNHRENVARILTAFGELFLSDDDRKRFLSSGNQQFKYALLKTKAAPKLEPLWYLVISVCRILQSDDFSLKAEEAYWLGLVDEVQGSGLPNLRELAERVQKKRLESEL